MLINNSAINDVGAINNDLSAPSQTLLYIEKNIEERVLASGTLLQIAKNITKSISASTILSIEKQIVDADQPLSFYERFGWQPIVTLGSLTIPDDQLTGGITIVKSENDNHTAQFTIRLPVGTHNLYNYMGKAVTISYKENGVIYRRFTGFVNKPSADVLYENLTFNCISDRRTLIRNLAVVENYIGYYSPIVLQGSDDAYERINARIETIDQSLDYDSYNSPTFSSWTPKNTADFSLGSSQVYRKNPRLEIEPSDNIINQVNISFEYSYQRLHYREAIYSWDHPYAPLNPDTGLGGICNFLRDRPSMPTKDLIRSAADGAGWPIKNDYIYFGKQFKTGNYLCSGRWASWSTIETGYLNAPVVDSNNNPVLDSSGNPLVRSVQTQVADNTDLYTMNSTWAATTRFNQNIKEIYNIVVKAPTSQNIYGALLSTDNYSFLDLNQYENWEKYDTYQIVPDGPQPKNYDSLGASYFINGRTSASEFNNAYITALHKAKTTILKGHRDTTINFQKKLEPTLELKHTVALTGKWVRGKGKCIRIIDQMNISENSGGMGGHAYVDVTIALYRGVGSTSEDSLVPTSPVVDTYCPIQAPVRLDSHIGIDPNTAGSENWTGYVGNKAITQTIPSPSSLSLITNYTRSQYQESFIVNTPSISGELRNEKILPKSVTYNINIPNETSTTEYQTYGGAIGE